MTFTDAVTFIQDHRADFLTIAGYVCAIATVLNRLIPGQTWLNRLLGRLAAFDQEGRLSLPVIHGNGPKRGNLVAIGALALIAGGLAACAHLSPGQAQYQANFTACLKADGIADAGGLGAQVFDILDNAGGKSAAQIQAEIESLAVQAGGTVTVLVVDCAVQAWLEQNPPGDGGVSEAIVAARSFRLAHAHRRPGARR